MKMTVGVLTKKRESRFGLSTSICLLDPESIHHMHQEGKSISGSNGRDDGTALAEIPSDDDFLW